MCVKILLVAGAIFATVMCFIWVMIISPLLPHSTSQPRLNVTCKGFRIKKNRLWQSKRAQFKPSQFTSRGWIIGREDTSKIQAHSNLDGCTRDEYHTVHRTICELNYDPDKAQFYLENLQPNNNEFRWRKWGDSGGDSEGDSETYALNEKRLYLDQKIQLYFSTFSLEIEPFEKNPNSRFNYSLCFTFFAYQLFGLYLLFRSLTVPKDSTIIICSPVLLLLLMTYILFNDCRENYKVYIPLIAFLTIAYFWCVASSNKPTVTANNALIVVYILAVLCIVLPRWEQIKSNGAYYFVIIGLGILAIIAVRIPNSEIGSILQIFISVFSLLYTKDN